MRGILSKVNEKILSENCSGTIFPPFRDFQMPISRKCFHLQTKKLHFPKTFQYTYQIKLVTNLA